MRECGECTVCCLALEIPEMNSPVNEFCKNCTDSGCSIYKERPIACSSFNCLWIEQEQIPESLRPDKCHVMFELPYMCSVYIGYETKVDAHKEPNVLAMIQKINEAGHSVVIKCVDGNKIFSLTAGQTKEEMHNDINNSIRLQAENT